MAEYQAECWELGAEWEAPDLVDKRGGTCLVLGLSWVGRLLGLDEVRQEEELVIGEGHVSKARP